MRTSAAALAPSPVSQPFESRWCWSWCCVSSAYGTNSFLGALVVSRVLGRQDRFPRCVAVPCWSRSRHGVQGRWPAADTRAQSPQHRATQRRHTTHTHPHVTHTTHCDSGRPAHATHARSWRDRSSRTRSPRGRTRAAARPRCWRFPEASSRDTALVSAHNQRYLLTYLLTYNRQSRFRPRLPPRGDPAGGASAARARGTVQTSWATRRVKHAHHKTSRRRRRSGEDLGHPADERCGGLA